MISSLVTVLSARPFSHVLLWLPHRLALARLLCLAGTSVLMGVFHRARWHTARTAWPVLLSGPGVALR